MTHPLPQVWPVIHLSTELKNTENVRIAVACGCPGVFLIHMGGEDELIDPFALQLKRAHPSLMVGVNYLTLPAHLALERSLKLGLDATWTDNPGVRSDVISSHVEFITRQLGLTQRPHLFFGSVAFKYQPAEPDPAEAARRAAGFGMIPTTSGSKTGVAPEPAKLAAMRQALGDGPLAVASGFTPDNAYELGRFVTHILVSTGISKFGSDDEFDETLLRRLIEQLE